MMQIARAPIEPAAAARLSLEELAAELREVDRARPALAEERERLAADTARGEEEHHAASAHARRVWGRPDTPLALPAGEPAAVARGREEVAALDARLAGLDARRGELRAALRRRAEEERAALDAEGRACDALEREIAGRLARLRELTAPLLAFESYPAGDGLLPLEGATWRLQQDLDARRRALDGRARTLARVRHLADAGREGADGE